MMNTLFQIEIIKADDKFRQSIVSLLQTEKLPVEDLPSPLDNFFIAVEDNNVIGVIGLEQYDKCGLLRSMVVNNRYRNKDIASRLVRELEEKAGSLGIESIYLLTETATAYFEKKGYEKISRTEVPKLIQASTEFSSVCPDSAIVMKKAIA
jgi:amino-acid N-acetyltransferase